MTVLHRSPRGKDPVLCWCSEMHSSAQAVALNLRDTLPRKLPKPPASGWADSPYGGPKRKKCSCTCSWCKGKVHKKCKGNCK